MSRKTAPENYLAGPKDTTATRCYCGAEAEYELYGVPACALHRAVADVACEEIGEPPPRWEIVRAVAVMSAPVLLFLGGCGREGRDDPNSYLHIVAMLVGYFGFVVSVAVSADRIARWVEARRA